MFTDKTKLSAIVLGILLSFSMLQPALAADGTERHNPQISDGSVLPMARNSQQNGEAPCADSKKQLNDNPGKTDNSPDTWYERQSRIPGG